MAMLSDSEIGMAEVVPSAELKIELVLSTLCGGNPGIGIPRSNRVRDTPQTISSRVYPLRST